ASVVASDISPGMVERGRARTAAEGFEVEWLEADAEALPFEDGRFDCVGSVFGAMLAPRPEVVAAELLRVVRPGGAVGLTAWTPDSVMAELFAIGRRFAPPPPDMPLSEQWGDEATARERHVPLAARAGVERRTIEWTADSPAAFAEEMISSAPTMAAARAGLPSDRFEDLRAELGGLMARWNVAPHGSLRIEADYALIVARRRG
ncbi:MAG: class I SAM-dependent methyltransferase, partial [Thermoleophilaceae bacterium]